MGRSSASFSSSPKSSDALHSVAARCSLLVARPMAQTVSPPIVLLCSSKARLESFAYVISCGQERKTWRWRRNCWPADAPESMDRSGPFHTGRAKPLRLGVWASRSGRLDRTVLQLVLLGSPPLPCLCRVRARVAPTLVTSSHTSSMGTTYELGSTKISVPRQVAQRDPIPLWDFLQVNSYLLRRKWVSEVHLRIYLTEAC